AINDDSAARTDATRQAPRDIGYASATTMAEAMPPSWERDRCQRVTPRSAAAAATVPETVSQGRPSGSETISQSCQDSPVGAPNALATASLAANRAANESGERGLLDAVVRSASVNNRSASSGVRSSAAMNRSTRTTSIPTATITESPYAFAPRSRRSASKRTARRCQRVWINARVATAVAVHTASAVGGQLRI